MKIRTQSTIECVSVSSFILTVFTEFSNHLMWALRRASRPLTKRGIKIGTSRVHCAKSEIARCYIDDKAGICEAPRMIAGRSLSLKRLYSTKRQFPKFFMGKYNFSSQAGTKSSREEDGDLEDGFSDLESLPSAEAIPESNAEDVNEERLISEPELSDGNNDNDGVEESQNDLELSDTETGVTEKRSPRKRASSALFKAIMAAPGLSIDSVLDKWVEEGNDLTRKEISQAMINLRMRCLYLKALQFSEWLVSTKQLDFVEKDYSAHLSLIAKVHGLQKAENYIEKIPKSCRGELIYQTLLANCVTMNNLRKAVEVFNKLKVLEFTITSFACNQLLLLYKRFDKKKIADVLLLMEKENVKPSLLTYKILIDTKGQSNDLTGMDQIVEMMKAEGIEPDINTKAILAKHYVSGGQKEKAEVVLKDMEGGNLKDNRWACQALLPLYAALGKPDEVGRVWKVCESNPWIQECMAAIDAWGKLNKIEEAEAVFDRMLKMGNTLSSKHYIALLRVYANNKMLAKGKEIVKQMADSGCKIGPFTWDAVVKLYVGVGEVEKADSILQKATHLRNQIKPMITTYMAIMEEYAKRGDVHNSEKMFHRMRQARHMPRLRQFQALTQAYINAKAPAYGIRERMRAGNVFPNKALAGQLALVDAFRKNAVSELLD